RNAHRIRRDGTLLRAVQEPARHREMTRARSQRNDAGGRKQKPSDEEHWQHEQQPLEEAFPAVDPEGDIRACWVARADAARRGRTPARRQPGDRCDEVAEETHHAEFPPATPKATTATPPVAEAPQRPVAD